MSRDYKRSKYYSDHLKTMGETSANQTIMEPITKNGKIINAPNINIRDTPNINGSIIGIIRQGTVVEILNEEGEYVKIKVIGAKKDMVGYVRQSYCEGI